MARTSRAALALMDHVTNRVEVVRRLRPPADLNDEQSIEFERVVASMPADWFCPGHTILLSEYAFHVVLTRHLNKRIERLILRKAKQEDLDWLFRMKAQETKLISQLMSKLRLTPQAVAPKNVSMRKMHEEFNPFFDYDNDEEAQS